MLHFLIIILNFSFFAIISHHLNSNNWKLVIIFLQNTERINMRKIASKNMSSPHKNYPNTWARNWSFFCDQLCPEIPYKLQIKYFWTNLIPIKCHCYFCKVYKVTVTKQLKFLFLITIYEKYCNSKKLLCNDIEKLLSSSSSYVFSSCFLHEKKAAF